MRKMILSFGLLICLTVVAHSQNKNKEQDDKLLYVTQLKAIEAFDRHDQVGEAKKILQEVKPELRGWEWKLLNARVDRSIQTLQNHTAGVVGIAITNDGKYLATGSADKTIIIWDAFTYQPVKKLEGHKAQVTTLDFSPDGKWLLSGSSDKTLRLWNVAEGKEEKNFNSEFSQGVYQAKFSPDGNIIGAVSWEFKAPGFSVQGFAKAFDVQSGKLMIRIDTDVKPATSIDFTPDGKKIITGTWNFVIRQHELSTGNTVVLHDLSKLDYYTAIQSVAFSRDGKLIVESGKDDRIRLLQADGKLIRQIDPWEGHSHWVNCVRFSSDGKYFASASEDGLLKVWETSTANNVFTFKGHKGGLNKLAWHPDGNRIFTSSADGTVKVWDLTNPGERTFKVADDEVGPWCAPVTPDGKYIVVAGSMRTLSLWNLDNGTEVRFLDSSNNNAAIITGDAKFIAAAGSGRQIGGYDLKQKLFASPGHTASIFGMAYNKKLNMIASAGDRTIRIWNASGGVLQQTLAISSGSYAVAFSPDGQLLASGGTDGKLRIFSTKDWKITDSAQCGPSLRYVTAHANGKYLVAVGELNDVFVYDLEQKKIRYEFKGHSKTVYGAATHPTLPLAVTVGYDKTARIWNLETGINTLTLYGFKGELYTTAIVNNGNRLILTETNGKVHVIDL